MIRIKLAVAVFFLVATLARANTCEQVFAAISFNGTQYPVHTSLGYPPPIVSGTVPLNVQFRTSADSVVTPSGTVSLRYVIDNQPTGPVLINNFAWNMDTTGIPDGTHALSVLYVNETRQNPCATFLGRQYAFVVSNGTVISGTQVVPVIGPPDAPGTSQYADFITYPGYQPHSVPHPFQAQVIPPAGGIEPTGLWAEPLVAPTSNFEESLPAYWQLQNGAIVEGPLFTRLTGCDDLREPTWGFDASGPSWEQRKGHFDGQQDDASLSSFVTFTANLDGAGFYGIGMDGRLFFLNMDGSVQTLAGWVTNRDITPFDYLDGSIPMSFVEDQQTLVGSFDVPFKFPTDLAIDPNDHSHIFVADMQNNRIALVDLSHMTPVISTYAGVAGESGYRDGPAKSALFNQPSSIAIAPDETIYVADAENSVIRKIDSAGNVATLVGLGPSVEPTNAVVASSPLAYAPRTAVPFTSAYINYPNTIRFDSKGNLVLAETVSETIRYVDLNAQTVTTLAQFAGTGSSFGEQVWIDVDRNGNVGGKDDIIATMVSAGRNGLYRIPITGTTEIPLPTITKGGTYPLYRGRTSDSSMPWTYSPWSVAIDDQEGRLVVSGADSSGVVSLRLLQPTDPAFELNAPDYEAGRSIWFTGTVPNFPLGSRPSFAAVHGYEGHSGLGNVLNFDDLVAMTDSQLGAYLQNGAEGSVARPELTGDDLRNVIYYIRRTATGGDLDVPGPSSTDNASPIISGSVANQIDSTDATVSWITDEVTLGFVTWGTTPGSYFGWSPLESAYSAMHSVTVPNLPASQTVYFVVRVKDQAGNQTASPEQIINLH